MYLTTYLVNLSFVHFKCIPYHAPRALLLTFLAVDVPHFKMAVPIISCEGAGLITMSTAVVQRKHLGLYTTQKIQYVPGNHHAIHFLKCPRWAQVIIKVSGHQYQWLAVGYDLDIGHF